MITAATVMSLGADFASLWYSVKKGWTIPCECFVRIFDSFSSCYLNYDLFSSESRVKQRSYLVLKNLNVKIENTTGNEVNQLVRQREKVLTSLDKMEESFIQSKFEGMIAGMVGHLISIPRLLSSAVTGITLSESIKATDRNLEDAIDLLNCK